MYIEGILFLIVLGVTMYLFSKRLNNIVRVIRLGRHGSLPSDNLRKRLIYTLKFAFGQSEMFARPVVGALHFVVYASFIIINIELVEILIDGILGSHRIFMNFLGRGYKFLILAFEYLAVLVIVACVVFLIRRNVIKIKRFHNAEMTNWPKSDANYILIAEIVIMSLFLLINISEFQLAQKSISPYSLSLSFFDSLFPSVWMSTFFSSFTPQTLIVIERLTWYCHIFGIFAFLIYITYSKHLHIIFAFPVIFYRQFTPLLKIENHPYIKKEIDLMLGKVEPENINEANVPEYFGVKDLNDLTQKQILEAFSCTECGRCTSVCPQNITGKKLSPRKIMMGVRDRAEDVMKMKTMEKINDGKKLTDYLSEEEIMACNTCGHCVEVCPIKLNPLSIIMGVRQFLVLDEAKVPETWVSAFSNIENNDAPWQFPRDNRDKWSKS